MKNCKKCGAQNPEDSIFCSECGFKFNENENQTAESQKSFKLDKSKENNMTSLLVVGFIILMRVLGPIVGSYIIAGAISGAIFGVIGFSIKKREK